MMNIINTNPTNIDIERWEYRDFIDTLDFISYLLYDGEIPFREFGSSSYKKHKIKGMMLIITHYVIITDLQDLNNILRFKYKSYMYSYYVID